MFAGVFAGEGNYKIVMYYFVFLLIAEATSFALSLLVCYVKRQMPAIKAWVEAK